MLQKSLRHLFQYALTCIIIIFVISCTEDVPRQKSAVYYYSEEIGGKASQPIYDWYVFGPVTKAFDADSSCVFEANPYVFENYPKADTLKFWYNGLFHPRYNLLDLREIFGTDSSEEHLVIDGEKVYLYCDIECKKSVDAYFQVKSSMKYEQWLNGDSLVRKDVQGENFYPIHLKAGNNRYFVKVSPNNEEYSFESRILDSISVASVYVNGQSNNIVFPEISADNRNISFTNSHQNILNTPVDICIQDVQGNKIFSTFLSKDSTSYHVPDMQAGNSYLCKMTIAGKTVRQPVVCGSFDDVYHKFVTLRKQLPDAHKKSDEIDQILYRLKFLLEHETRQTDWWWQFKIAPLTYQLEGIFANKDSEITADVENDFNVKFVTYTSELDGGPQRYLLVTPDNIDKDKCLPLVVIVRPVIENHYHFFVSPQFAQQWAVNIIQSLANQYDFIVMLPEARMYQNEDLIPFANSEMKLAIDDLKSKYRIDVDRIYLHGICTGGTRALRMATENPGMFAAIGLYAPIYHVDSESERAKSHSLEKMLPNISGVPVFIHSDPFDRHTPFRLFSDLITDCKRYGIPVTLNQKRNTELLYNAVVAGEEAFAFFEGKTKAGRIMQPAEKDTSLVIEDLYSSPFVYVYSDCNHSSYYRNLVHLLKDDYEKCMYGTLPLIPDEKVDEQLLQTKNLFLIGNHFDNPLLGDLVSNAENECPEIVEQEMNCMSIHQNQKYRDRSYIIFQSYPEDRKYIRYPWIFGVEKVMKSDSNH